MQKVNFRLRYPLYGVQATQRIEQTIAASLPPHTLMQRAGLAVARLALALAPHAQRYWIACGAGNNGGDGLEAAMHLQRWNKQPLVTWLGRPEQAPADALASYHRAVEAGVSFAQEPAADCDLTIDALLGIGARAREPEGRMAQWITLMQAPGAAPVLSVDLPTGLQADSGVVAKHSVRAQHTLSLLTLKPGLFTAHGRDAAGTVWLEPLDGATPSLDHQYGSNPDAWLGAEPAVQARLHASHKGSYGDVAVVGGAAGMTGAALLAASAALHSGAGRVFVCLLDGGTVGVDATRPELMFRAADTLDFRTMTVVCGCGGGEAIAAVLARTLSSAASLVLDADAINVTAHDTSLQTILTARGARRLATVLTPHPLEAARLLGSSASQVQCDRLGAARELARRFDCTVVLKGSGTIIAAPAHTPVINATGNARLASAGTGDVLAGMIGAQLAAGLDAFDATCLAVYRHGLAAEQPQGNGPLVASELARMATLRSPGP